MGQIRTFLMDAWEAGEFVFLQKRTPEQLLEALGKRNDANDTIRNFLACASKTVFLNLTAIEILAGKCKEIKLERFGVDYLQQKVLAENFPDRLARVMREAAYWDRLGAAV